MQFEPLSVAFGSFHILIGALPQVVIAAVSILVVGFLVWYLLPAISVALKLKRALKQIGGLRSGKGPGGFVAKEELDSVFSDRYFLDVWQSYRDTLHEQRDNQNHLTRIRSTTLAENIFTGPALVDARLNSEFFKHLPGILTGIGIIGTFFGLIVGVHGFDPTQLDPKAIQQGLKALFGAVREAFVASAIAILAAMVITLIEKVLINVCYRRLEDLCRSLDSLYDAGVGEDYLAELVRATQETKTNTANLKDSLVNEMSELLHKITDRQIEANERMFSSLNQNLGSRLDMQISHSEDMSANVAGLRQDMGSFTGGQQDALADTLGSLVSAFTDKMQQTFGDQTRHLTEMMTTAAQSMQSIQAGFDKLVADIRTSGDSERNAMSDRVKALMDDMESRQVKLNSEIASFVASIKEQVQTGNETTQKQLAYSVNEVQKNVKLLLSDMQEERRQASELDRSRQEEFQRNSLGFVTQVESQVSGLIEKVAETTAALKDNVSALNSTTINAIEKLNDGAQMVSLAADDFTKAGEKITGVMKEAEALFGQLNHTGQVLSESTRSVQGALQSFASGQERFTAMVEALRSIIDQAKEDAGMNKAVVADMRKMVESFGVLKDDMDEFVDGVATLLEEKLGRFREDMGKHNTEFHKHLSDSVKLLGNAIQAQSAATGQLMDMMARVKK
ncbi:MAG: anti-phage defense ZorAB system ZorA [Sulfuritalea sp.]|nr:anti-phage defense ZorAB system ZorA [Sulfuritalea sp.]